MRKRLRLRRRGISQKFDPRLLLLILRPDERPDWKTSYPSSLSLKGEWVQVGSWSSSCCAPSLLLLALSYSPGSRLPLLTRFLRSDPENMMGERILRMKFKPEWKIEEGMRPWSLELVSFWSMKIKNELEISLFPIERNWDILRNSIYDLTIVVASEGLIYPYSLILIF